MKEGDRAGTLVSQKNSEERGALEILLMKKVFIMKMRPFLTEWTLFLMLSKPSAWVYLKHFFLSFFQSRKLKWSTNWLVIHTWSGIQPFIRSVNTDFEHLTCPKCCPRNWGFKSPQARRHTALGNSYAERGHKQSGSAFFVEIKIHSLQAQLWYFSSISAPWATSFWILTTLWDARLLVL